MSPVVRSLVVLSLALWGCHPDSLSTVPEGEPAGADPAPGDTDEPVPCMFYGVDEHGGLWRIDPDEVSATLVGQSGIEALTDIAILPDGTMVALGFDAVYTLSPTTGAATLVAEGVFTESQVAADSLPNGRILVGGERQVASFDLGSLQVMVRGNLLPSGWSFSGDYAVIDASTAYATAKNFSGTDSMFFVDFAAGSATNLGSLGYPKVFGLDFGCDGTLYGLVDAAPPRLVEISVTGNTFAVQSLGLLEGPVSFWGGAGPAY